ncbi:MAG: S8 family serine peptidase [Coprothermobacterota bacterium]|nr:S8 family serine peptidase [Coprothermobacterota bacterium]
MRELQSKGGVWRGCLAGFLAATLFLGGFPLPLAGSFGAPGTGWEITFSGSPEVPKVDAMLLSATWEEPLAYLVYLTGEDGADQIAISSQEEAARQGASPKESRLAGRVALIDALQTIASRSQSSLLAFLAERQRAGQVAEFRSFWISYVVFVRSDRETLWALATRPEVKRIDQNPRITLEMPRVDEVAGGANEMITSAQSETDTTSSTLAEIGWNITMVGAPAVWAMGYRGEGIVVASIDSGVDWTHPALARKFRAYDPANPQTPRPDLLTYSWFDATSDQSDTPRDTLGHGTHTMGTMVASDPQGGHQYGIAPNASWISADAFGDEETGAAELLSCGQWILAPGGDPGMAPDIVSNSWSSDEGVDPWFRDMVRAWRTAGIFPSWSIGNYGPAPGSACEPGAYPESFASGMVDRDGILQSKSSRGPSFWEEIKPEVVAPGVGNPSTVPGGSYSSSYAGTSMACPHTSGVVALLLQINPTLSATGLEELLLETAQPRTNSEYPTVPNNGFGWGLIDARAAAIRLLSSVTLITPRGGEQWPIGVQQKIRWSAPGVTGSMRIEISREGAAGPWQALFAETANDGEESWLAYGPASPTCLVRVSILGAPFLQATSPSPFALVERRLQWEAPQGGEAWDEGSRDELAWSSQYLEGTVSLELNRAAPEGPWEVLFRGLPASGSVTWLVTGPASPRCRLRVRGEAEGESIVEALSGLFAITQVDQKSFPLDLFAGWNMVSLPLQTSSSSPAEVFASLAPGWRLYAWDAAVARYRGQGEVTLSGGAGFWLKSTMTVTYPIVGMIRTSTPWVIGMEKGWNLIGNPYELPVTLAACRVSLQGEEVSLAEAAIRGWLQLPLFHWDGVAYHGLNAEDSIFAGWGCWLKAAREGLALVVSRL